MLRRRPVLPTRRRLLAALAIASLAAPAAAQSWSADVLDASAVAPETTGAVVPAADLPAATGQPQNVGLYKMAGTQDPPPGSMAQRYVFVRNGQTLAEWPAEARGRIGLVKLTSPTLPSSPFALIANNGAAAGAVAVLFMAATTNPTAIASPIPAANIPPADGERLIDLIDGGAAGDPPNGAISAFPLRLNRFFRLSQAVVGTTFPVGTNTFEPTIGADGDGNLFYSVTPGAGVAVGFSAGTYKSTDFGRTWTDVSPTLAGQRYPPETNDPYIYVDQTTGRVFQFHMSPILLCSMMAWTDDAGATWSHNPVGCSPTGAWDHQTMVAARPRLLPTVDYPNVLHQCVSAVAATMCARSLNGGTTWSTETPVHPNPGPSDDGVCGTQHGHLEAAPDGTIYLPTSLCGTRPTVFVSRDDGITWERSEIAPVNVPLSDPDLGLDRDGNVYAGFIDQSGALFMSVSRDAGRSWSTPLRIGEGITAGLPAVAAGDPGRVVVSFVGTDDLPQGFATPGYPGSATGEIAWAPYLAVSTNMLSDAPTFAVVDAANGDPISRGAECVAGDFRCVVQFDFLDVTIAPDGRPYAAFVDGCQGACVTDPNAPLAGNPAPGIVATLAEGPLLCVNGCPWKFTTETTVTTAVDDAAPAVEYRRGWHRREDAAASGGGYHRRLGGPGGGGGESPTARLVFDGHEITYFFLRSQQGGAADVFIDGALAMTVDYYGPAPGSSPDPGHSVTFDGLAEGRHEILIAHRSGAVYVDGFEIVSGGEGGADPLAAATRSATTVSTGVLAGLGSTSLTRAVVVEPNDEWLSVVVEGAAAPVTVELVDPLGGLVAQGAPLVSGSSAAGLDVDPGLAGTYTVRVLDSAGSPATVEISIARTTTVK
jgi:BNR repeat-like domain